MNVKELALIETSALAGMSIDERQRCVAKMYANLRVLIFDEGYPEVAWALEVIEVMGGVIKAMEKQAREIRKERGMIVFSNEFSNGDCLQVEAMKSGEVVLWSDCGDNAQAFIYLSKDQAADLADGLLAWAKGGDV